MSSPFWAIQVELSKSYRRAPRSTSRTANHRVVYLRAHTDSTPTAHRRHTDSTPTAHRQHTDERCVIDCAPACVPAEPVRVPENAEGWNRTPSAESPPPWSALCGLCASLFSLSNSPLSSTLSSRTLQCSLCQCCRCFSCALLCAFLYSPMLSNALQCTPMLSTAFSTPVRHSTLHSSAPRSECSKPRRQSNRLQPAPLTFSAIRVFVFDVVLDGQR